VLSKKSLFSLSLFTLFGFSFIGILINFFFLGRKPIDLFAADYPFYTQIGIGLIYGLLTGLIALFAVRKGLGKELSQQLVNSFKHLKLTQRDTIFYSFCAGFGEEVLFRAGIQPWLGLWPTAIIFVAIHGYLNPTSWSVFSYGLLMVLMSAGLGYLYQEIGLLSAIAGHFMYDVIMFWYLIRKLNAFKEPIVHSEWPILPQESDE